MPPSEFSLSTREARVAALKKIEARRPEIWKELLKQLRSFNPSQKIAFERGDGTNSHSRDVVVDGTRVGVRLDTERVGSEYHSRPGRYYFTIGRWRRHVNQARAIEKKTGFDWARIAQLVEAVRQIQIEDADSEARHNSIREAREAELKALYERRPELRDVADFAEIAHGNFTVTLRSLTIEHLESALDLVRLVRSKEEAET
jgi:hypothetical protein